MLSEPMRPDASVLARKVHELREEAGLTQVQLSFETDVAWTTISRIENDETTPNNQTLRKLAKRRVRPAPRAVAEPHGARRLEHGPRDLRQATPGRDGGGRALPPARHTRPLHQRPRRHVELERLARDDLPRHHRAAHEQQDRPGQGSDEMQRHWRPPVRSSVCCPARRRARCLRNTFSNAKAARIRSRCCHVRWRTVRAWHSSA